MKKTVYSWMNPRPFKRQPEIGASMTRQDQNLSMRELMDRYRRGMPLDVVNRTPQYHNGEFPDLNQMDLSEIESLKRATYQEVERLQKELRQQEEDKQRAAWEAKDKEIQELKKLLETKGPALAGQ